MQLGFQDVNGETGIVYEDYSVEYDGAVQAEVERIVATVPDTRFETTEPPPKVVFQELIIDLYAVPSIVSIARADADAGSTVEGPRRDHRAGIDSSPLPLQSETR